MQCFLCWKYFYPVLTIKEIFSWKKVTYLCATCQQLFEKVSTKSCPICGKKSDVGACGDCEAWRKLYPDIHLLHTALFYYNDAMKDYFERYKFMGDYRLRVLFSPQIQHFLKREKGLVLPIPLSKERLEERGYNQVEALLQTAQVPYFSYLEKKEETLAQSHKTRKERLETGQPFSLSEEGVQHIQGQRVCLVDDIYTTGRTLYHAAQLVQEAGAKEIVSFSVAR